ncbi:hypothetical protein Vadar_033180 [Vaccinium darrowii]|uniref:Uncharacterized protein n=1 Tax=Vaccinium darrowii TaxID=229202 RepID=A0ACB7XE30_9ERIC|nr:hypothetical protein Vadar_033180 [Vaccinium darrowii]
MLASAHYETLHHLQGLSQNSYNFLWGKSARNSKVSTLKLIKLSNSGDGRRLRLRFGPGRKMLKNETNPHFSKTTRLPRKRFYRARAHSNPLSDSHFPVPISPCHVDYSLHYPQLFPSSDQTVHSKKIQFADIGCGFGGLLISLSTLFPDTLMIGMELRDKVTEYVKERILALRVENPGQYQNVSVVRTNSMKYIPNYFEKGQLSKMFFLFPDPHFKEKNHRRRVISPHLLDEYAYALCTGGIIYTITDVEELGEWMKACLEGHPMFEALRDEELEADPVVKLLSSATEEGQKVARNGGQTFQAVYRRVVPSL